MSTMAISLPLIFEITCETFYLEKYKIHKLLNQVRNCSDKFQHEFISSSSEIHLENYYSIINNPMSSECNMGLQQHIFVLFCSLQSCLATSTIVHNPTSPPHTISSMSPSDARFSIFYSSSTVWLGAQRHSTVFSAC
uniref:Uncharacterized protein n=1 Tax=Trichobilharzia regenti TaxID=157069 RepID=A0AA85JZX9_TRIRE